MVRIFGSNLPSDPWKLPGEVAIYEVFMLSRLFRAIKDQLPSKSLHIFELAKRLEAVRKPEYLTDVDYEIRKSFYGDMVIVRDQLGPLVADQFQLVGFVSDRYQRVVFINGFRNWSRISADEADICGIRFAQYESSLGR